MPECTGRLTGFGFEDFGKMGGMLETKLVGDFTDGMLSPPTIAT